MTSTSSRQRLLLGAAALVLAWAPAAVISAPGAERSAAFVSEASAQGALEAPAPPAPLREMEALDSAHDRG